ncbi:MAG: DNA mismatch repair protein MutS [Flavobacteriaceae bacterium]|nr:DNA mismatch repair protein MutS [Flavobacteriaceae bacterium]
MIHIHHKTLQDLELPTLLSQISAYCKTELGQNQVLEITPYASKTKVINALHKVHEYISSFDNDNKIPKHSFQDINAALKMLTIEDSILELESFIKIATLADTSIDLILFFKKFETYYPTLNALSSEHEIAKDISQSIRKIIDRFGEVKDKASDILFGIRKSIHQVRGQLNSSFISALQTYSGSDYLDDIRETVLENKRVLAVKAMHRRKVKGSILGSSKTGSIVYIEPEATLQLHRELNNLEYEEREEINKILKSLTNHLRIYHPLLQDYQKFLTQIDVISAKALYSQSINGVLPTITNDRFVHLKDAYHPLLYLANKVERKTTYPQTIKLSKDNRIIVISGPNAGGKSITLKTVGLLQVMLQCGVLVPVHERSTMCIFNRILSDIGDNQSIENHLSTYSYRLKQMNYFLKKCNDKTLFLIDEFGTGSDPELGGALAETFLEVFYDRESFGIITTHYTNLKLLANELPYMQNASMRFDERSLEPIYKLALGQAGSSFTFEVAQKNGIPYSLINKAKKKIERGKVRFDKTIAKLQKERSKLEKTERSLKVNEQKKIAEADKLEEINTKVKKKLESYQELFDANQRLIYLGQKIDTIAERYHNNKKKGDLMNECFKIIQIENSKRKKIAPKQKKIIKAKTLQVKKEVEKKVAVIREKKKEEKRKAALQPLKPKPVLKVGDRVRLEDGRAVGTIDKIEKQKAVVNYGLFTTSVSVTQLELVESAKP